MFEPGSRRLEAERGERPPESEPPEDTGAQSGEIWATRTVRMRQAECGQALAETALFSVLAVLLGFGILALIPVHRTRSAATVAAYACAQFVSQSPNPNRAAYQAELVARKTLDADWSGTLGAEYTVQVAAPSGPGALGGCTVFYKPPLYFGGLLGLSADWSEVTFFSRSEAWKARWR